MTVIEVFADVSCPFTHVGLQRWTERRRSLGRNDVGLRVRAWPLELVNGQALTSDFVAHEVEALRAQVAPDLFGGFRRDRFPATTLRALRLTDVAYGRDLATGEAVALELRDRLFERGQDIADPAVLREVARRYGVEVRATDDAHDPVRIDLADGTRRGVVGSPHFFGPGIDVFCPSLAITKDGDEFHIDEASSRFDHFADACFATGHAA